MSGERQPLLPKGNAVLPKKSQVLWGFLRRSSRKSVMAPEAAAPAPAMPAVAPPPPVVKGIAVGHGTVSLANLKEALTALKDLQGKRVDVELKTAFGTHSAEVYVEDSKIHFEYTYGSFSIPVTALGLDQYLN